MSDYTRGAVTGVGDFEFLEDVGGEDVFVGGFDDEVVESRGERGF